MNLIISDRTTRMIGTAAGIVAIILAFVGWIIGYWGWCGFIMFLALVFGALMLLLEGTLLLPNRIPFIEVLTNISESRPHWQKAVLYLIFGLILFFTCMPSISMLAALPIILTAVLYAVMQFVASRSSAPPVPGPGTAPAPDHIDPNRPTAISPKQEYP